MANQKKNAKKMPLLDTSAFCIVEVLTDSKDPKQYIKKMKSRDPELKSNWGTICTLVQMTSEDGKRHKEMAASTVI